MINESAKSLFLQIYLKKNWTFFRLSVEKDSFFNYVIYLYYIIIYLFFNISMFAQDILPKVWVEFKSKPTDGKVTIISEGRELRTLRTPSKLKLPYNIYTLIYKKKGYLDKKITIKIDKNSTRFSEEIQLEMDEESLISLKKELSPPSKSSQVVEVEQNVSELKANKENINNKNIIKKERIEIKIAGLTWDGESNKNALSRDEALEYCRQKGKRLPSSQELISVMKELEDYGWHWSASETQTIPVKGIIVSLYTGEVSAYDKNEVKAYARCVK